MKKTRVYELAKEFHKDTRELLDLLSEMEIEAVSHASSLSEDDAERIRERLAAEQTHEITQKRISRKVIRRRKTAIEPVVQAVEEEFRPEEVAPEPEAPQPAPVQAQGGPVEEAADQMETEIMIEAEVTEAAEPVAARLEEAEPGPEPELAQEPEPQAPPREPEPDLKPGRKVPRPLPEPGEEPPAPEKPEGETTQVVKPRWTHGEPARIISRPSVSPAAVKPGPGPRTAPPVVEEIPGGFPPPESEETSRRRRGKAKKKGKKRDVGRAELYSAGAGRFRGPKVKRAAKKAQKTQITQPKAIKMRIKVAEAISVAELAKRMGVKAADVVKQLLQLGMMVSLNQPVDLDTATIVANEFGYEVERSAFEESDLLKPAEDRPENLKLRPPVVTIMGHVDHGKSSLLEAISTHNLHIVDGEAGGITQHIGAYAVDVAGSPIVFLDTPGHEAFTAMRARGAEVTDIVVLVVAADDGVMEQTKEAINHSRAAKVPIIVAVNKMDKPDIDPDRVKRELSEQGLQPEEWGGDTLFAPVSAKTGQGIDDLLETIKLQAELLELKADQEKAAEGRVIEAQVDRGRGIVATVLVQGGTLKVGDAFVVGSHHGRVRALINDKGQPVDEAGPSIPVQVQGISGVPEAGDEFQVVEDDRVARQISEHRQAKRREAELSQGTKVSLETFLEKAGAEAKELNIVIKADVQGSIEALRDALERLSTDQVKLAVIHTGAGAITESDIMLASASRAIVIGFNVRANAKVSDVAEQEKVEIRYYDVIYKAIEEVREAMAGLLESIFKEHVIGRAEVREVFKVPKIGAVAGCYITDGLVRRGGLARLVRDGVVTYEGKIASLRRFKDDAREVAAGYECGIGLEGFNDIKIGDAIEVFELEEIRPELAPAEQAG